MNEWKTVRLGEICEQINGVSYKPADVYDSLTEKTTILLRANNIFEDKLNYDELVFVDKKRISENQYMKKGDILICASSGSKHLVGKAACLTEDKDLTFGAFCKVLRPKTVNPEYIKHYFFSPSYRTEISRLSEGANINNIKAADLDNLKIPLPSKSIQNKIAKQLDKCVKIINNQKKALEKYDTLIKSRFIEMFGEIDISPQRNDWTELKDITTIYTGTTPSTTDEENWNGDILWITPAEMTSESFYIYDTERKITEKGQKSKSLSLMPVNTVLLSTRAPIGKVGIVGSPMTCNQGFKNFYCKEDILNPVYLYFLFKSNTEYLNSKGTGTTFKELSKSAAEKIKVPIPDFELQNNFAAFVQQIDKSKFAVQKSLEKTETLYKSLMQEYFE